MRKAGTPHSGLQTVLRSVFKLFEQKSPGGGSLRLSLNDLCPGSLPQGEGIILKRSAGRKNSVCTEFVRHVESFHVTEMLQNVETRIAHLLPRRDTPGQQMGELGFYIL